MKSVNPILAALLVAAALSAGCSKTDEQAAETAPTESMPAEEPMATESAPADAASEEKTEPGGWDPNNPEKMTF